MTKKKILIQAELKCCSVDNNIERKTDVTDVTDVTD